MTTLTKALITASIALAIGNALQFRRVLHQQVELDLKAAQSADLKNQIEQARLQRDQTLAALGAAQADLDSVRHQTVNETGNTELDTWVSRVDRLKQSLRAAPERRIPELQYLSTNDWFSATIDNPLDTDARIREALKKLRGTAKMKPQTGLNIMRALQAYLKANNGVPPSDTLQLCAFLNPPLPDEILRRYETVPQPVDRTGGHGGEDDDPAFLARSAIILREKATVDEDYDTRLYFTPDGGQIMMEKSRLGERVGSAMQAFSRANNGKAATTPEELLPYFSAPVDQTKLKEYWAVQPKSI